MSRKQLTIVTKPTKEVHNLHPVFLMMIQLVGRVNTYPRSKVPMYWTLFGRRYYSKFASM